MSALHPNPVVIDRLAERVAELLEPRLVQLLSERLEHRETESEPGHEPGLIGVADLARHLGRSPDWVRAHAEDLGVVRFGDGTGKPRLWFDIATVDERIRQMQGASSPIGTTPAPARRNGGHARTTTPLLEIRGQR